MLLLARDLNQSKLTAVYKIGRVHGFCFVRGPLNYFHFLRKSSLGGYRHSEATLFVALDNVMISQALTAGGGRDLYAGFIGLPEVICWAGIEEFVFSCIDCRSKN